MSRIFDNLPSSITSTTSNNNTFSQIPDLFMDHTLSSMPHFLQQGQQQHSQSSIKTTTMSKSEEVHKLAYEWSFWQHIRLPTNVTGASTGSVGSGHETPASADDADTTVTDTPNTTASDVRDVQYIQDTTILSFPRVFGKVGEQTDVVDSVEQFWESLVNMQNVEDVADDTEYFFFKKGIKPLWEDESNKRGGRWSLSFSNPHHKFKKLPLCIFWEMLLLRIVSGKLLDDDISIPLSREVLENQEFDNIACKKTVSNAQLNKMIMDDLAGVTISIRNKKIIVSIWNTHLAYEDFKSLNGVTGSCRNEEYLSTYREKLKFKSKQVYEELGLTVYQFRQLIFHSVNKILNESFEYVRDDDTYKDMHKIYNRQIFKYTPHFYDGSLVESKKNKYGTNEGSKGRRSLNANSNAAGNADWFKGRSGNGGTAGSAGSGFGSNTGEKFSKLGQVRKKVEFNDKGLIVEELNVMRLRGQ